MDYFTYYYIACDYGKIYNISKYKNIFYEFERYTFMQNNKRFICKYLLFGNENINRSIGGYRITCNRSDRLKFYHSKYKDDYRYLTIYKRRSDYKIH